MSQTPSAGGLDVARVRKDFPIFEREINGKPLVYLDSANSTQKPRAVIDAMVRFIETSYAPVNRSSYQLAMESDGAFEGARSAVAK
ncbi:MAG: aminotransferase class V-fold PLP-dependent enzyme, partial [Acidimicrobiia bacterium]